MDDISRDVYEISLSTVVSKVNLVESNPKEQQLDTGATRHVWSDKAMFTSFKPIENRDKLFMRNSGTSAIEGQGKVFLKMTFRKQLTLNNVLYVPEIYKNLVSGSLLSKNGFHMVFETEKFVASKSEMHLGMRNVSCGLF